MMAADIVDAAAGFVPDEPALDAVEAWEDCVLQVCDLPLSDFFAPTFIDESCLMVMQPVVQAFETVDIRVHFVSSESDSSWDASSSTVGADGVVQGVSVVTFSDEPTIAAFVSEHADDPWVEISDYGDGWWIDGFPLELQSLLPEYACFSSWDETAVKTLAADGTADLSASLDDGGDWSWDGWCGVFTGDENDAVGGTALGDVPVAQRAVEGPRTAAFADMGSMAALAATLQFNSMDTAPFGVGRRRR